MHVLPLPYRDPIAAFQAFAADSVAALLDSASNDGGRGRYAYIAAEPFRVLRATDVTTVDGVETASDPFTELERQLAALGLDTNTGPTPFAGGAVGFIGYEAGRHLERLPAPIHDPLALPEMMIGFYDTIAAFDLEERKAWILGSGQPETSATARRERAEVRAQAMRARIEAAPRELAPPDWTLTGRWRPEQPREGVKQSIARVIDYIHAGDIFQANLTQRMLASRPHGLDDFNLYRRLRALSPAPFAAFLRCGHGLSILSASPERFLRLTADGHAESRPIKGTRPRDADPARDAAFAAQLVASEKDRAENLMIVDLLRNDLGRVSRLGSIRVPELMALESFASVHHLVSSVEGRLRPGLGPVDLLRACFPGGSITGAPKIRAMEIIRELEVAPRGVYCGGILWIGFDGAMDSNIVIRTLTSANGTLVAQAGGGIVADSNPAAEYDEAMLKMQPMLNALSGRGGET